VGWILIIGGALKGWQTNRISQISWLEFAMNRSCQLTGSAGVAARNERKARTVMVADSRVIQARANRTRIVSFDKEGL
jgi:hypothetical protein